MFGGSHDPTLLRQFFRETDKNNNGFIEVTELGTIVRKMYDSKKIKYDDAKIQEDVEVSRQGVGQGVHAPMSHRSKGSCPNES